MQSEIILGLFELAKISLNSYFSAMSLAGKTEAEIDEMFLAEFSKFKSNAPSNLPDVEKGAPE